jgi:arylsulfatase
MAPVEAYLKETALFRGLGGQGTGLEGGFRAPAIIRWPGKVPAGKVENGVFASLDWFPTFMAAAGDPTIADELKKGKDLGGTTYKVHLDGYNQLPYLTGQVKESPRREFFYFSDDGDLTALRFDNWKFVYAQQRAEGTMLIWGEPYVKTRLPWLFNLRTDPYERASITSNTYWDWYLDNVFMLYGGQAYVAQFLATFKEFPPRQKAASFTIDQVMEQMKAGIPK